MMPKRGGFWVAIGLWVAVVAALILWRHDDAHPVGWDLDVYKAASRSLAIGHDPYLDATAIQQEYHKHEPHPFGTRVPFCYVYSPVTLPFVRPLTGTWHAAALTAYWILYGLAALVPIGVALWTATNRREAAVYWACAPLSLIFPAMILNTVIFSGNIAYILHGAVLLAAWRGWKRGQWIPFYLVVFVASCFKAPMLYLLAIPVLSERKQWTGSVLAAIAGVGMFASQHLLYPSLFRNYLVAVELQFSYNHDFSASPAGLLADALYDVIPYKITTVGFYLFYAGLFLLILFPLRARYLRGQIGQKHWIPVMLVGVALLNIRIMEYDIAAITMMMVVVAWRFFEGLFLDWRKGAVLLAVIVGTLQIFDAPIWRSMACCTLVGLFFAGAWQLYRQVARGLKPV
jgi:hypothetical protein